MSRYEPAPPASAEIEVTAEMIEAGVDALCYQLGDDPYAETAELVYRAMETARRAAPQPSPRVLKDLRQS